MGLAYLTVALVCLILMLDVGGPFFRFITPRQEFYGNLWSEGFVAGLTGSFLLLIVACRFLKKKEEVSEGLQNKIWAAFLFSSLVSSLLFIAMVVWRLLLIFGFNLYVEMFGKSGTLMMESASALIKTGLIADGIFCGVLAFRLPTKAALLIPKAIPILIMAAGGTILAKFFGFRPSASIWYDALLLLAPFGILYLYGIAEAHRKKRAGVACRRPVSSIIEK